MANDILKVLDAAGVRHIGKKIGRIFPAYIPQSLEETSEQEMSIVVFGISEFSQLSIGDSIVLYYTVLAEHPKTEEAEGTMVIDSFDGDGKPRFHLLGKNGVYIGEITAHSTEGGEDLPTAMAVTMKLYMLAQKSEVAQGGTEPKKIILNQSNNTWYVEGSDAELTEALKQGEVVNIEYGKSKGRISFTPEVDPGNESSYFGTGIVKQVNSESRRYYIIAFGSGEIYNMNMGFIGSYGVNTFSLDAYYLTESNAASTYAKKADLGRKLTATASTPSRVNEFNGTTNHIESFTLTLSDTSIKPKAGDIITATAPNGDYISCYIYTDIMDSVQLNGMIHHSSGVVPYSCMLIKTGEGVYMLEAWKVLMYGYDNSKTLTQAQYDALTTKDPNITYYITE